MDKELKAKWVAALRSGDYKQGYTALRQITPSGNTWCPLGVLADQIDPASWIVKNLDSEYSWPVHLLGDVEIEDPDRYGFTTMQQVKIMQLNDVFKENFDKIADHIEAVL